MRIEIYDSLRSVQTEAENLQALMETLETMASEKIEALTDIKLNAYESAYGMARHVAVLKETLAALEQAERIRDDGEEHGLEI